MQLFDISKKVFVITGATGVLGGSAANYLAKQGAKIAVLGRNNKKLELLKSQLGALGAEAFSFECDILSKPALEMAKASIVEQFERVDVLLNIAGGNMPGATIANGQTIFDMSIDDFQQVTRLNLDGTVLPSMVFGAVMAKQKSGAIINYSSMATDRVITRVAGYSASKAAMENFTKWMSVEMALKFGDGIRVNAIAPGFFIGNQNRKLLLNEDGGYTQRGNDIIRNTPMQRFGKAEELNGAIHYLASDASNFVTGTVLAVDGGFSAFSGV